MLNVAAMSAQASARSMMRVEGPSQESSTTKKTTFKMTPQRPNGVLAVHLKDLRISNGDFFRIFEPDQVNLYVRAIVGGNVKSSSVHPCDNAPCTIFLDDLKHFFLQVNPQRSHIDNNIRLDLVGFDRPDVHRVLSHKSIQSQDLVKNQFVVDTFKFVRNEKVFAELDTEFCFSYGAFGYGYANQLEDDLALPQDKISHSMFCRFPPPDSRSHGKVAPDVMSCLPVGHPAFINFTGKANLVDLKMEFGEDVDLKQCRIIEEPMILISKMRKRVHLLQQEYGRQGSRKKRLQYLKSLIRNEHLVADQSEEISMAREVHMKRRVAAAADGTSTSPATLPSDGAQGQGVNVAEMTRIIALAPGVVEKKGETFKTNLGPKARRPSVMPWQRKVNPELESGSYELLEAVTVKPKTKADDEFHEEEEEEDKGSDKGEEPKEQPRRWSRLKGFSKATASLFRWIRRDSEQPGVTGDTKGDGEAETRRQSVLPDEQTPTTSSHDQGQGPPSADDHQQVRQVNTDRRKSTLGDGHKFLSAMRPSKVLPAMTDAPASISED